MRILFLSPVGVIGGAERCLLDMVASLRACAPEVEIAVLAGTEGPLVDRAAELGAQPIALPMPAALAAVGDSGLQGRSLALAGLSLAKELGGTGVALARYAPELRRAVSDFRPTVIHSNGIKTHLLASLLPGSAKLVWHIHDFLSERPLAGSALKTRMRRVSLAIANSMAVAEDTHTVLSGVRVETLLNGVDTQRFAPGPGDGELLDRLAALPSAAPGTLRLGLVATYARWKGQVAFIRAANVLQRTAPHLSMRFFIVGGPLYKTSDSQFTEAELRELVHGFGLDDKVGFVPFQEQIEDVYRALDIVVHASTRREPFGLTIAEAMACGRPVIASRAGGAGELFETTKEVFGLEIVTPRELAEVISWLAADVDMRRKLGEAARKAAVERLSRNRLGPQLLGLYEKIGVRAAESAGESSPTS